MVYLDRLIDRIDKPVLLNTCFFIKLIFLPTVLLIRGWRNNFNNQIGGSVTPLIIKFIFITYHSYIRLNHIVYIIISFVFCKNSYIKRCKINFTFGIFQEGRESFE